MSEFDDALALVSLAGDPTSFGAMLTSEWTFGGAIHGGFLLALATRALSERVGSVHGDPLSVSAHYLSAARPGPATLRTEVIRTGRSLSTGSISVVQEDEDGRPIERVRVLATCTDLTRLSEENRLTPSPPPLPDPAACVRVPPFVADAGVMDRVEVRLDPISAGWLHGDPSGEPSVRGWFRLADGRAPDPLALLLAVDSVPATSFQLGITGYVPTIELTAHIRARPAPGWLRVAHTTRGYVGGYFEEDMEVWDSTDRMVAQSRQLARAPRQPA